MTATAGFPALVLASLLLVAAIVVMAIARRWRRRRGFGRGRTLALDDRVLRSKTLGLSGRPDRLLMENGVVIPEEWKSGDTLRSWHQAQLGVYFLLIEDEFGRRPPHGYIVCGAGERFRVENTDALRDWVLGMVAHMRTIRSDPMQGVSVRHRSGQCAPCGMRALCRQARF